MIIGAILQTASVSYAMLVVARIITGFGNGLNVWCSVPSPVISYQYLPDRLRQSLHIMLSVLRLIDEERTS